MPMLLNVLLFLALILAQSDSITMLEANTPVTIRLDGAAPSILAYDGQAGETISISAQALDDIDTVIELLKPDDHRLAYNDDHEGDFGDLDSTDSAIFRVALPETGRYTLRVNSFNGVQTGDVAITLVSWESIAEIIEAEDGMMRLRLNLGPDAVYTHTVAVETDNRITITANDPLGRRDLLVILRDGDGTILAQNDDHDTRDLTLDIFDAHIDYVADADGDLSIELREFLGRAGMIELIIMSKSLGASN